LRIASIIKGHKRPFICIYCDYWSKFGLLFSRCLGLASKATTMALTHSLFSPGELVQQIGENARELRLAQNLSRKTLAERAGVSDSTIKRFETTGQITLDALVLLASALGVAQQLSGLFKHAQPVSLDELKQGGRVRGRR